MLPSGMFTWLSICQHKIQILIFKIKYLLEFCFNWELPGYVNFQQYTDRWYTLFNIIIDVITPITNINYTILQ